MPNIIIRNIGLVIILASSAGASFAFQDASDAGKAAPQAAATGTQAESDRRYYLAPFGTFIKTGGVRNGNNGWGAGMGFGKMINENINLEVRGFWQGFHANGYPAYLSSYASLPWDHGSTNLVGGTVDFQYYLFRDTFSPYLAFGIGAMSTSYLGSLDWEPFNSDSSGTNISFVFEAGVGLTYELADFLLLRGDVRYRGDTAPGNFRNAEVAVANDLLVNFGFTVPLGAKPVAAE
jgi:OmpA-OmpF porin, OOP family